MSGRVRWPYVVAACIAAVGLIVAILAADRDDEKPPTVAIADSTPDVEPALTPTETAAKSSSPAPKARAPVSEPEAETPSEPEPEDETGPSGDPFVGRCDPATVDGHPDALISADTNGKWDVYCRDAESSDWLLVSVSDDEKIAKDSSESSMTGTSPDGRFVAFWSYARNLTKEAQWGIFVRDVVKGRTIHVPLRYGDQELMFPVTGSQELSISADGQRVAFAAWLAGGQESTRRVYLRSLQTAHTSLVSLSGTGETISGWRPEISDDGMRVAFTSFSDSSTAECPVDDCGSQIFLRDVQANTTQLISVAPDGTQGNAMSEYAVRISGTHIVRFTSCATNLVDPQTPPPDDVPAVDCPYIYERNLTTQTTSLVS